MANYKLVKPNKQKVERFKVSITGDWNDADYVTATEYYTKEEFETIVGNLNFMMKEYNGYHQLKEFTTYLYPRMNNLKGCAELSLPCSEYGICHSLEEVRIEYVDKDGKLWEVEIFE